MGIFTVMIDASRHSTLIDMNIPKTLLILDEREKIITLRYSNFLRICSLVNPLAGSTMKSSSPGALFNKLCSRLFLERIRKIISNMKDNSIDLTSWSSSPS
jgi:hypothetical protein